MDLQIEIWRAVLNTAWLFVLFASFDAMRVIDIPMGDW